MNTALEGGKEGGGKKKRCKGVKKPTFPAEALKTSTRSVKKQRTHPVALINPQMNDERRFCSSPNTLLFQP